MPRVLLLIAATLVLASCIPAEPDDDLIRNFDPEDTVMGAIQERGTLRVGIDELMPEDLAGFASQLGEEVADALGVDITSTTASTDELFDQITADAIDVAFPLVPITEARVDELRKSHGFTDPYLVAHQRLLVRPGYRTVESPEELAGETLCAALDEQTGLDLAGLVEGLTISRDDVGGCLQAFRGGEVTAVTGPDIVLAGMVAETGGVIVGDQLNTEGYGAVVEAGANAWTDYVSQVLEEAQQEGRWTEFFNGSFGELLGSQDPPGMSAEEAAALFPSGVDL